ncbi:MAG TPA: GAF domain-containing sensor histidine kinase [Candidatus Limnocylindrales bacterium]|jgi:signal transduction histidine kinase|nr:GAF domain-containing sensor histidine kinase [Candidatus Limnocylindrales bacterium]
MGSGRPRSEIEALSDAVGAVGGILDVEAVLQVIVDTARELVSARYAALGIFDDQRRIEQFITSGITAQQRAELGPLPEGHGLLGLIVEEGRSIRIPEIAAHPASYGFPPGHPPMHSLLGVPVRNKNRTLGNFYLTDKLGARDFTDDDQRLVELFALHAGIAMDNARLHEATGRLAVLEERDRIGKDLHDGIIQSIYGVSLSLEDVPELMDVDRDEARARVDRAIDALHGTIRDLRGFIFGLRPELVDQTDLVGLLVALTEQLRQNSLVEVTVHLPEQRVTASPHVRTELLQVAREALSNVARHSGASEVDVALTVDEITLVLEVTDNGRGFDPDTAVHDGHFGLANMRDRVTALGGDLAISSAAGSGTHIIVRIPTASEHEARADDD